MVFLTSVDSEPNLCQKLEDALGIMGNLRPFFYRELQSFSERPNAPVQKSPRL